MLRKEFQYQKLKITIEIKVNVDHGETPLESIMGTLLFGKKGVSEDIKRKEKEWHHCVTVYTSRGEYTHAHCTTEKLDDTLATLQKRLFEIIEETNNRMEEEKASELAMLKTMPDFKAVDSKWSRQEPHKEKE